MPQLAHRVTITPQILSILTPTPVSPGTSRSLADVVAVMLTGSFQSPKPPTDSSVVNKIKFPLRIYEFKNTATYYRRLIILKGVSFYVSFTTYILRVQTHSFTDHENSGTTW